MRATATMLATVAMALGAIWLAVAAPGADAGPAQVTLRTASGSLAIANSRAGQAVFSATGTRPGEGASGTVTIGNDGGVPGRFALAVTGMTEAAGLHGGLLSSRLRLVVDEVGGAPPVYDGALADLEQVDLGMLAPGQLRSYRVEALLPDGGVPGSATSDDNRFQGASLTVGLEWRATAAATATPPPDAPPAPGPDPRPDPPAETPAPVKSSLGLPSAKRCVKRGRMKVRLKAPPGTRLVSATVRVNGRVKARLKGARARKAIKLRGLGRKRSRLAVSVKASNGRTYSAARTYRACKR
jgi:hypothetical protein